MPKTYTAVTVANATAGNAILASDHSTVFQNVNNLIVPPMVSANRTTNQSVNNATMTAIQLNAADDFDTDAMHDTVTNNTRITVTTPGVYAFHLFASLEAIADPTTTNPLLELYKNGASIRSVRLPVKNGVDLRMTMSTLAEAALNDYFEMYVYQDSGVARNFSRLCFQAIWIGRTS